MNKKVCYIFIQGLNRSLLQWIKLWDTCVYKKEVKKTKKKEPKIQDNNKYKKYYNSNELDEVLLTTI